MQPICSAATVDVATAVDKLRADDAVITDPEVLLNDIESLVETLTGVHAVLVRRIRAVHNMDVPSVLRGRSTRNWLHEELLLTNPEAGRFMRLANQLPNYSTTEAAFDERRISAAHVSAILTALSVLPVTLRETVEPHLVQRAECCPPEEIAGFLDELLEALGIDKASDIRREKRNAERGVDMATTMNGSLAVSGTLTPEVGEKVERALAQAARKAGPDDIRTARQRRHDALGEIADAYLSQYEPTFSGAPRTVIVTMDLETLEGRLREQWIDLASGAQISAETARRLACDAELIPVVLGRAGEVLDIGQADHEFTTAQRRAAYVRDDGNCAFPKCTNNVAELHHIVFRSRGGPTSLDNAAWLCCYHHWLCHEGDWTLERADHGGYLWTNRLGHTLERFLDRHT